MAENRILVVGTGVSGLSVALSLLEKGYEVRLVSDDPDSRPKRYASYWAGANFFPFGCGENPEVKDWIRTSYVKFTELSEAKTPGILPMPFDWYRRPGDPFDLARWPLDAIPIADIDPMDPWFPDGVAFGHRFDSFSIDVKTYLDDLREAVKARVGGIGKMLVTDAEDLWRQDEKVVVNCTGLGSTKLFRDYELHPTRGQVFAMRKEVDIKRVIASFDDRRLHYVIPRLRDILLGGTYDEHDWSTDVRHDQTLEIIRGCQQICPELGELSVDEIIQKKSEAWSSLRPSRPRVRLRSVVRDDRRIVHNYGHGGAGFTLSWGCAESVVRLVDAHFARGR